MVRFISIALVFIVVAIGFIVTAQHVSAALCDDLSWLDCAPTGPESGADVLKLIENLTDWMFAGFMLLAVMMIVLAGWKFFSGSGDPQNITQAKSSLFWGAVAIAIAAMSKGFPVVIRSIIGV